MFQKKLLRFSLVGLVLAALGCSSPTLQTAASADAPASRAVALLNQGFVTTNGTNFSLNGQPYFFAGTNNYYLMYKSNAMVDSVLENAKAMNLKVIRIWGFMDGATHDGKVLQPSLGVYDESGFERLDYALYKANQLGIRLVIALVNNWSDFGGMDQYGRWLGISHDQFYTAESAKTAYINYMTYMVNRVNTYTQIAYKNDPTIFAWNLTNEARNNSDPTGTVLTAWTKTMSDKLRELDPNHMISLGDEGFFNRPGPYVVGEYNGQFGVDFEKILQLPNISYGTYHDYGQDSWGKTAAWSLQWIADHIAAGNAIGKPVVLEEFGRQGVADQVRSDTMKAQADVVLNNGGAAYMSWMLVGIDDAGGTYKDRWNDGFQFLRTEITGQMLTNHAQLMWDKNVTALPGAFSQSTPAAGATLQSSLPVFQWTSSSQATEYVLTVSENANLSAPTLVVDRIAGTSFATVAPLKFSTTYYWNVVAKNFRGTRASTNGTLSFQTAPQPPKAGAFGLLTPSAGQTSVAAAATFTWQTSTGADRYTLTVSKSSTLSNPVISVSNIAGTSYTSVSALEYGTTYYWKVDAINVVGSTESLASPRSFTTQIPPSKIDDFESYSGTSAISAAYARNSNGNSIVAELETVSVTQGSKALRLNYTLGNPGYAGVIHPLSQANWTGYNGIAFDAQLKLLANSTLTVQFKESSGEYWEANVALTSGAFRTVSLPWSAFQHPGWYSGGNSVVDPGSISELSFYLGGATGNGTLVVDQVRAYTVVATPTPTIVPTPSPTPTVVPTPSPSPTPTPTPTVVPTPTPTVVPSPTPTVVPTPTPTAVPTPSPPVLSSFQVAYHAGEASISTNSIKPEIRLTNSSANPINLANASVRYWFTADSSRPQIVTVYWSSQPGTTAKILTNSKGRFIEIGFASGTLAPGANVQIHLGLNNDDWSSMNQANDWSFNAAASTFVDSNKITVYQSGILVKGLEP